MGIGFPAWNGLAVFISVPAPMYSNECELVIILLNLTNSTLVPAVTAYGINSLKVILVFPLSGNTVGVSVASSTVKRIGSIFASAVADPPPAVVPTPTDCLALKKA